jgi:hypothetical protein
MRTLQPTGDVEYYLLNCRKYKNERERLIQKLYFIRGNIKLDLDILLEVNLARYGKYPSSSGGFHRGDR